MSAHGTPRAAALLSLLALAPLFAPRPARAEGGDYTLEELLNMNVETISRRLQPLQWAPATSVVVTEREIKARHYVNLRDLLQDQPEVDVYGNFNEEWREQIGIRGQSGNNNFLILLNGIRISAMTGEKISIDDNYPLFDAERVEIIYGPASALYGADAVSGIINIVTRSPDHPTAGGALAGSYGTSNYRSLAAKAFANIGEHAHVDVAGHIQASDNPNLAKEYPGDYPLGTLQDPFTGATLRAVPDNAYRNDTSSCSFSVRARLNEGFTMGYDLRQFRQLTGTDNQPQYTLYGATSTFRSHTVFATYNTKITERVQSNSELTYGILLQPPSYGFDNYYTGFERTYKYSNNQWLTGQERLSIDITDAHNLIVGITASNVHAAPEGGDLNRQIDPNIAPDAQNIPIYQTDVPLPFFELNYRTLGGYAQLQSQWTRHLATTVGVRFENDSRYGDTLNPRAGAVYQFASGNTLKVLYGESFLAPPPFIQYGFWGNFDGVDAATGKLSASWYHIPNPHLDPMKSRTAEISYTLLLKEHLLLAADAYYTRASSISVLSTQPGPTTFAGEIVQTAEQYVSTGQSKLYGGSISASYRGNLGVVGFSPWANYSYSDGRWFEDDAHGWLSLPYNTPHKIKAGVTLEYWKLSFTPRMRYLSASSTPAFVDPNSTERLTTPAAVIFDAALVASDLVPGLTATLDVRNAFNAHYYLPATLSAVNFVRSPQDTRTVMLQLGYSL